jgi:molybdopterin converting factor small subunit
MATEGTGAAVHVVYGGALRLVLGQAEATVWVPHGAAPTVQEVMDALTAGLPGAPPLGVEHCLAVVNKRVVPRGEWSTTVLPAGATVTVYPPLAGGALQGRKAPGSPGRRKSGCKP